jgi:hypothetical protein
MLSSRARAGLLSRGPLAFTGMGRAGFAGSRVASSSLTGGASSRWYSLTTASRQAAASPTSSSAVPLSRLSETFADGTSGAYVEDMYQAWKRDANSVHASWASYFRSVDAGRAPGEAFTAPPTLRGATAAVPPAGTPLPPTHSLKITITTTTIIPPDLPAMRGFILYLVCLFVCI